MTSLKFGTSGLRGLVTELVGLPAYSHVRAFCAVIGEDGAAGPGGEVLIGRDLRSSSPLIAAQCARAIVDAGLVAVDCGAIPTPALALAAAQRGAPAIMVTGSHIPDDRNGLKFYRRQGEIDKADEARILAWHAKLNLAVVPDEPVTPRRHDALAAYQARYREFFGADALRGLTVGVYQHSSVGRDVICDLVSALGATPVPLGRADRFIPVDTEALRPEDVALAIEWAGSQKLDAIVSTDGDADRPLVADEAGRFLRGDLVGALTAAFLGADAIVTPVTSNSALERLGLFQQVVRTRVGSPYVIAGMAEATAAGARLVVGFEANGGVLLGSDVAHEGVSLAALPTRDAMLPILATLTATARAQKPLSRLAAEQNFAIALSNRLQEVPQEKTAAFIARLDADNPAFRDAAFAGHGGVAARDRRDGLRLTLGDGTTVHIRASGNAPELRVYVEAPDQAGADALLQEGLDIARRATA
ncbi:phosphomannomutase [Bosea sp. (in: a-proteobacteria)]|uniref:phosphomannomutase n=1 Tax=Bosea sp. (in: a-proteobacteria) TaxID=1871050 RepID=UPI002733D44A|nr:phosphomannomutase [Bosea sp. (in: a-proteobacteria)]MDP3407474.1 phosphomannomutase [Bosea sp. (in: a-proteobacteria)]